MKFFKSKINIKNFKFKILTLKLENKLSNFIKFFSLKKLKYVSIYFLRKNKTFIKSKYTRTRQWTKTIVFFALWYGIINVFLLMYSNYRFLFIFSYIWWFFFIIVFYISLKFFIKNYKYIY